MRSPMLSLLAVAAVVLASCTGADTQEPVSTAPAETESPTVVETEAPSPVGDAAESWTVLVYSIADTDLEPFLLRDIAEMAEVGSGDGLNIVVLADRAAGHTDEPLLDQPDWETAKLLEVAQGSLIEVADLGEVNMGDPQLLADFIAGGMTDYPADRYALVLTDHGAAWPGVGGDESTDEHDLLTLEELEAAISDGLTRAGVDALDLLGFDACLMATYEVASAMAPYARYMLASEELEPGHGWDYRVLSLLAQDPSTDPVTLATEIIAGFEAQAQEEGTSAEITLSLIDLGQMPALDDAMAAFSRALIDEVATVAPTVGSTRAQTLSFGRNPDPALETHMTDLGLLISNIGVESLQVSDEADAVLRAIGDAVIDKVEGAATLGASGLSIYFPPHQEYADEAYQALETTGGWAEFLIAYYGVGEAIPAEAAPAFTGEVESFFDDAGFNLIGAFDVAAQENIVDAVISYGIVGEDGSVTFIGEEPATLADGQAIGVYDLTAFTISDGTDTAYAYLNLAIDEGAGIATIDTPLAYYPPGSDEYSDVVLSVVVDLESLEIIEETYYEVSEAGSYGETSADPEGLIVPQLLSVSPDGAQEWVPAGDVGLFADLPALQYDFVPLETGTSLYVELSITDFGGNSDAVAAEAVVP